MNVFLIDQIGNINNKYSFDLCNGLSKVGVNVTLITNESNDVKGLKCKFKRVFKSFKKTNKLKKMIEYISSWAKIIKYINIESVDVIHVQWITFSPVDFYFLNLVNKRKVKIIMTVHDILPFNKKFYDYYFHKKIYSKIDRIVLQAKVNVTRIQKEFNIDNYKCKYVPHGNFVDNANIVDKNEAKKVLDIPKGKKVFLFFGQIKKVKGLHILIQALSMAVKENENIYLIIAGKVWKDNFDYYRKMIENFNLENYVKCDIKFIQDKDICYYFSASDVVVLPYLEIYQSGVVQLAYAYCKPVIASNIGGLGEVVENNKTGILVPKDDVKALSQAMIDFSHMNTCNLKNMGKYGNKYAEKNFNWEKICKSIKDLYD
ncbi:hypothetical protein NL50_12270 [Clostridium acetobutylicum]|nr:hypothetical protein NL50_12270 [Clostridium acetobutylicum]